MSKINNINNETGSLTVDPGASGDSAIQLSINSAAKFKIGIDDDDSDNFKIAQGSALGSNDCFVVTSSGFINKPLQPAFAATPDEWSDNSAVTGDGTVAQVSFPDEIYDIGSNYNAANSTFTAPITGIYKLSVHVMFRQITSSHDDCYVEIVTSNRTYRSLICNPYNTQYSASYLGIGNMSVLCDMDASDTAYIQATVSGSTKVIEIGYTLGTSNVSGMFSGVLIC